MPKPTMNLDREEIRKYLETHTWQQASEFFGCSLMTLTRKLRGSGKYVKPVVEYVTPMSIQNMLTDNYGNIVCTAEDLRWLCDKVCKQYRAQSHGPTFARALDIWGRVAFKK